MKYSDQISSWLVESGYTHCFYVAGGNIMHLIESLNNVLDCRPVIHEVAAGIATEYFNETSDSGKALSLVTAGPGLTNIVTAIAGAYLESRELLVIGGQVKTADLSYGKLRQNGIQEIDGVQISSPICNKSICMDRIWSKEEFIQTIGYSNNGRKGPIFLEIPLDIQAKEVDFPKSKVELISNINKIPESDLKVIIDKLRLSKRPVLMLGGGISRKIFKNINKLLKNTSIPIVTTWNAMDRIGADHPNYVGRPNTWGQRSANIILQQADILIALGTRLGLQQTGFNWQEFIPLGEIIQVDIDSNEIGKGHPKVDIGFAVDANDLLQRLLAHNLGKHDEWLDFCRLVRDKIPLIEEGVNVTITQYVSPYKFVKTLSNLTCMEDIIIPCSSGSAFTIMMQVFEQKFGQKIVTNKGLASMGYGLSGAIGASIANPDKRVILVEGDGGFAQNIQEIGTAAINNCNLKIFIFDDNGYASIRMTQSSYFNGNYVGCDRSTGLGIPDWEVLFQAWGVKVIRIDADVYKNKSYLADLEGEGLVAFIVTINPKQTYFPKISSKISESGSMISSPLHLMTPELPKNIKNQAFKIKL
jgi:acetolactate synthase I/II/III large subunit